MRRDALLAGGFALAFVAITTGLLAGDWLTGLDLRVYEWSQAHRPATVERVGRVLNRLGQGGVLLAACAVLAGLLGLWRLARRRRDALGWWRAGQPMVYVLAAAVLLVPTVLFIKHQLTDRGAPSSLLPPEQTVELLGSLPPGEYAAGYPGGHLVNAIVWYGVLVVLINAVLREVGWGQLPGPVRVAIRVVPPVIVLATTTYLSFHWLTDGLAGLAFGLLVDRLLAILRRTWLTSL